MRVDYLHPARKTVFAPVYFGSSRTKSAHPPSMSFRACLDGSSTMLQVKDLNSIVAAHVSMRSNPLNNRVRKSGLQYKI